VDTDLYQAETPIYELQTRGRKAARRLPLADAFYAGDGKLTFDGCAAATRKRKTSSR